MAFFTRYSFRPVYRLICPGDVISRRSMNCRTIYITSICEMMEPAICIPAVPALISLCRMENAEDLSFPLMPSSRLKMNLSRSPSTEDSMASAVTLPPGQRAMIFVRSLTK